MPTFRRRQHRTEEEPPPYTPYPEHGNVACEEIPSYDQVQSGSSSSSSTRVYPGATGAATAVRPEDVAVEMDPRVYERRQNNAAMPVSSNTSMKERSYAAAAVHSINENKKRNRDIMKAPFKKDFYRSLGQKTSYKTKKFKDRSKYYAKEFAHDLADDFKQPVGYGAYGGYGVPYNYYAETGANRAHGEPLQEGTLRNDETYAAHGAGPFGSRHRRHPNYDPFMIGVGATSLALLGAFMI
ncbi:hypothetical protein SJAG_00528 [Schizosaccharomyces japonicus yFS275]|uniref:Uncharacterized protein n=1 Tax=Schizosaccharomyces japonicus (strain yFS275 / FY16936) TaxID=402676 RepID=B6JVW1_SCHJY|nr:hypothetical protein SJAG_00528 [Schizosaccharomyces japonicus yFS275]EEB05512.1 hypothetical protein SJAG_00528 [Schizosaccharomyces japonicus yFS275]